MELAPLAFIARLAALVPPPRRHTVRYFGVLASHSALRSQVVPGPASPPGAPAEDSPATRSRYIPWAELLRRTLAIDIACSKCQSPLRLIALIKAEPIARKLLTAMHLPTEISELHPRVRRPEHRRRGAGMTTPATTGSTDGAFGRPCWGSLSRVAGPSAGDAPRPGARVRACPHFGTQAAANPGQGRVLRFAQNRFETLGPVRISAIRAVFKPFGTD